MERIFRYLRMGLLVVIMVQYSQDAYASGVRISWQPSSEGDAVGYKVYYGTSSRNYDNVIDVGNVTAVEIGDLEKTNYFIAVTAYNSSGEESEYSEEMTALLEPNGQGQLLSGGGSDTSGDSGSGGGGCFISTSSDGISPMQAAVFSAVLWSICIAHRFRKMKVHWPPQGTEEKPLP